MFSTKLKRGIFFKKTSKNLRNNIKMINTYTAEDKIFLKCSYLAALNIAKLKKPYLIVEKLLKLCMIDI